MAFYELETGFTATAAANTQVVLTLSGAQGQQKAIKAIYAYFTGSAGTGDLTIEAPSGTVMQRHPVVSNALKIEFPGDGIRAKNNTNLVIKLAAGGAGAIGVINVIPATGYRPY
jgi:hypothetical protein